MRTAEGLVAEDDHQVARRHVEAGPMAITRQAIFAAIRLPRVDLDIHLRDLMLSAFQELCCTCIDYDVYCIDLCLYPVGYTDVKCN